MQPEIMIMESNDENKTPDIPCCQPQMPVLAELLCSEVSDHDLIESGARSLEHCDDDSSIMSYFDPSVLHHPEIMSRLQFLESQIEPPKSYFHSDGKIEILPFMRKVVASWMLEVCEEQRCDEAVFPLAISLLDQFLSDCLIKKEQLQLVACVCLLLASKTRQCNHFSLELLCWYTDNSVSPQSLRTWELAILSQLNWDVNIITPMDFVDQLLVRSACEPYNNSDKHGSIVRRHAITFIALCSTEPRFVGLKPSLIAASAIYAAVRGLRLEVKNLSFLLSEMASVSQEQLRYISTSIEQVISSEIKVMEQQGMDGPLTKEVLMSVAASSSMKKGGIGGNNNKPCASSSSNNATLNTHQISEEILV